MSQDFYVVLPSNSCPELYPENAANNYTVSWENPLPIKDNLNNWNVALTEMSFNNVIQTVNTKQGLQAVAKLPLKGTFSCHLKFDKDGKKIINMTLLDHGQQDYFDFNKKENWNVELLDDGKLSFTMRYEYCSYWKILTPGATSLAIGLSGSTERINNNSPFVAPHPTKSESLKNGNISLTIQIYSTKTKLIKYERYFPVSTDFANVVDFLGYFIEIFKKHFLSTVRFNEDKRVVIMLHKKIVSCKMINGLNFLLGFEQTTFVPSVDKNEFMAQHKVQLHRAINNIYVYGSICKPIHVGGAMVPLLKSVWLDVDKNISNEQQSFGKIIHVDVKNPMYLPVAHLNAQSIEINVRSDSGYLIPFTAGSVTSVTLHFKRVVTTINRSRVTFLSPDNYA